MSKIVLHLKSDDVANQLRGWHMALYREMQALCAAQSIPFEIRARDRDIRVGTRRVADRRFEDGALHIIDDRSVRSQGVLNAGVAYLWEYWHLDPQGTKAFSSAAERIYDPTTVTPSRSLAFQKNLKRRYRDRRRSKYDQPEDRRPLPVGALSVFCQGSYPIHAGAADLTDLDLLAAVQADAGDRPILVKPHPKSTTAEERTALERVARRDGRVLITDGNVHDILAVSACTVSVNSTVALEGYMHDVPCVLFGRSDFHHLAATVGDGLSFAGALDQALAQEADLGHYLAWYFLRNCLHLKSGRLQAQLLERFAQAGFPLERLRSAG